MVLLKNRINFFIHATFVLSIILISTSIAQWEKLSGPPNENVNCFIRHNNTIFAGAEYYGVYYSTNNGNSWEVMNTPYDGRVYALAMIHDTLISATSMQVRRTTNFGATWETGGGAWIANAMPRALAVLDEIIFAGGENSGMFRSTDFGKSWYPIDTGLTTNAIAALTVHHNMLFVETRTKFVFRSTNYGLTWERMAAGIPDNVYGYSILSKDSSLFVGTQNGVYRSDDDGVTWAEKYTGLPYSAVRSMTYLGDILFVTTQFGVYKSTDNGESWTSSGLQLRELASIACFGTTLFGGDRNSYGGIYVSNDSGQTWIQSGKGISYPADYTIAQNSTHLFMGTPTGGFFRSTDQGDTWAQAISGAGTTRFYTIASDSNSIFAGTSYGVIRSTDNGTEWFPTNQDSLSMKVTAIAIRDSTVFAGTEGSHSRIYRSTNYGNTWSLVNTMVGNYTVYSIVIKGNTILASLDLYGIVRSTDNGLTWNTSNTGMVTTYINCLSVVGNTIYAGTDGPGVYRSTDDGVSWTLTGLNSTFVGNSVDVNTIASNNGYLFAGTSMNAYVSMNNGDTWKNITEGNIAYGVKSIAFLNNKVYVCSFGSFYRRSLNEFVTSISKPEGEVPSHNFSLEQNYPNPFNPSTTISFNIGTPSFVTLKIYNTEGEEIVTLASERLQAGRYTRTFNANNISSGIYFYTLQVGSFSETKKLLLLK